MQNGSCPWNVPVPVEPGRFVSVLPAHRELNIRVAPRSVFGCQQEAQPDDSLLFADLQTSLHTHMTGRLGSGRAGFFGGWYVKGVGRTPLAANWNRRDHLHNSGHLAASSAIREYVVTRYLQSQGLTSSIVGCEGVLVAELDPELRDYHAVLYGTRQAGEMPAVDRALQALTVKRGQFARHSNFVWLLHHLSPAYVDRGASSLGAFCELLAAAMTPPDAPAPEAADTTPDSLAALLAACVQRASEHFRRWFSSGVWWGSFTNNLTLDGRFLDLETPALLGGPCLGSLSTSDDDDAPGRGRQSGLIGTELLIFLAQTRVFCRALVLALANLPSWFTPPEREFAAELAAELERQVLAADQLLGSRDQALDLIGGMLGDAFGRLPAPDLAALRAYIAFLYDRELGAGPAQPGAGAAGALRMVAVPGHARMVIEPGLRWRPFAVALGSGRLLGPTEDQCRVARRLAELIADLDHTTSLAALVDKLAALSRVDPIV
ncbi:MAG TPA: hypothetical protein VFK02_27925 [Kofleriaceae bacterium]|nr:hypothetical protein [Kofleriaceae bacterium]